MKRLYISSVKWTKVFESTDCRSLQLECSEISLFRARDEFVWSTFSYGQEKSKCFPPGMRPYSHNTVAVPSREMPETHWDDLIAGVPQVLPLCSIGCGLKVMRLVNKATRVGIGAVISQATVTGTDDQRFMAMLRGARLARLRLVLKAGEFSHNPAYSASSDGPLNALNALNACA